MKNNQIKPSITRHKSQNHHFKNDHNENINFQSSKKSLSRTPSSEAKINSFNSKTVQKTRLNFDNPHLSTSHSQVFQNIQNYLSSQNFQDQKNNVKVYLRFRPVNEIENKLIENGVGWICPIITENVVKIDTQKAFHQNLSFSFDAIFDSYSSQEDLYSFVGKPIVNDVTCGYNGTIFAYGQSGSGKTYTMYGTENNDRGLIPRVIEDIFTFVESTNDNVKFQIKLSVFQIYKEIIYDLLTGERDLKIKENPERGIYVEGLSEVYLTNLQDFENYSSLAQENRIVSGTKLNQYSSRSHSIMIIEITQTYLKENIIKKGILNLVDLAGSEKVSKTGAVGETLEEAKKINLSLSALGNVIHALTSKREHIPYRDSKLTRILQESLGGNYKTSLIITCSPHSYHIEETISSLLFAQRAKTIKNKVKINIKLSYEELQNMIVSLKEKLANANREINKLKNISENERKKMNIISKEKEQKNTKNIIIEELDNYCSKCGVLKEEINILKEKINTILLQKTEKEEKIKYLETQLNEEKHLEPIQKKSQIEELYQEIKQKLSKIENFNQIQKKEQKEDNNLIIKSCPKNKIFMDFFQNESKEINKMSNNQSFINKLQNLCSEYDLLSNQKKSNKKIHSYIQLFENMQNYMIKTETTNLQSNISFSLTSFFFFECMQLNVLNQLNDLLITKLAKENKFLVNVNTILITIIDDILAKNLELNIDMNNQNHMIKLFQGSRIEIGKNNEEIKTSFSNNDLKHFSFIIQKEIRNSQKNSSKFLSFVSKKNIDIQKNIQSNSNRMSFASGRVNTNNSNGQKDDFYTQSKFEPSTPREGELMKNIPFSSQSINEKKTFIENAKEQPQFEILKNMLINNIKKHDQLNQIIMEGKEEIAILNKINKQYFDDFLLKNLRINKEHIITNNEQKIYSISNIISFTQNPNTSQNKKEKDSNIFRKCGNSAKKNLSDISEYTNRKINFENYEKEGCKIFPKEKKIEDFINQYLETGTATRRFDGIKVQFDKNKVKCLYASGLNAENKFELIPLQNKHINQIKGDNDSMINELNMD